MIICTQLWSTLCFHVYRSVAYVTVGDWQIPWYRNSSVMHVQYNLIELIDDDIEKLHEVEKLRCQHEMSKKSRILGVEKLRCWEIEMLKIWEALFEDHEVINLLHTTNQNPKVVVLQKCLHGNTFLTKGNKLWKELWVRLEWKPKLWSKGCQISSLKKKSKKLFWLFSSYLFGLSTKFGHWNPRPFNLDDRSVKQPITCVEELDFFFLARNETFQYVNQICTIYCQFVRSIDKHELCERKVGLDHNNCQTYNYFPLLAMVLIIYLATVNL